VRYLVSTPRKPFEEGSMFRRAVVSVAVIAAMLGPIRVVSDAAKPILQLALQRADMPAATRKEGLIPHLEVEDPSHLRPFGVRGLEAAQYRYTWPAGETLKTPIGTIDKEWHIEGEVFRAPDVSGAKRFFVLGTAARIGAFSYESFPDENLRKISLPAYGDEQFARVGTHPGTGLGVMVFVRKRAVVWQLRVATIPLQFQATEAQMVAVLETYAAKQKSRVGTG